MPNPLFSSHTELSQDVLSKYMSLPQGAKVQAEYICEYARPAAHASRERPAWPFMPTQQRAPLWRCPGGWVPGAAKSQGAELGGGAGRGRVARSVCGELALMWRRVWWGCVRTQGSAARARTCAARPAPSTAAPATPRSCEYTAPSTAPHTHTTRPQQPHRPPAATPPVSGRAAAASARALKPRRCGGHFRRPAAISGPPKITHEQNLANAPMRPLCIHPQPHLEL
jgi:hypothetical protein